MDLFIMLERNECCLIAGNAVFFFFLQAPKLLYGRLIVFFCFSSIFLTKVEVMQGFFFISWINISIDCPIFQNENKSLGHFFEI